MDSKNANKNDTNVSNRKSQKSISRSQRETLAAHKIQSHVRGQAVRTSNRRRTHAATKIQSQIRGRAIRRKGTTVRVAPANIPRPTAQKPSHTQQSHMAATKIQAQFRGRAARRTGVDGEMVRVAPAHIPRPPPASPTPTVRHDAAATKIQAQFRGRAVRLGGGNAPTVRVAPANIPRPPSASPKSTRHDAAATKIQAQFRGRAARLGGSGRTTVRAAPANIPRPSSSKQKADTTASNEVAARNAPANIPRPPSAQQNTNKPEPRLSDDEEEMAGEATDVAVKMHDDYLAKMARRPQPKQHKTHDNKTKNEYGPSKKMGALKKKTSSASNYHRNRMYQKRPSSRQTTRVNTPNRAVPGLVGPFSRMKQLEDMIEELKTAIDKTKAELKETVSQKNEEIAAAKAEAKAQLTAQLDAHNKREAETEQKYKEMLLARDEAILQQKMNSTQRWNDQQVLLTQERNKVKKLDQLVKEQDGKIKYVREELKKEEEEFEQLHEEYNSIQNKLSSSEQKMGELQDTISFQVDEIDRHKVIVRRLDLQLAKAYPPKEDACCSARSYSENDLIGLREDSIATKEAQIEILNKRIAELTDTIDTVEATIPPLKELVDHQEAEIEKLRRANHRQNAQLDRYRRDELEAKGKADAVEVATKQNSQLLLLLQREEANSQKLQVENEDTQAEIKRVKANNLDLTSRLAETEAALKVANALKQDTEEQQKKINKLKRSLRIQKEECEKAINDNNRIAKAEVASITDELQQRRRAHYLQLEKLSSKSQSYQEQKDSNEYLTEQNQILGDRVTELEGLLKQANDSHAQTREAAEQKERQLNATITQLQLDVAMGNQEREKLESDLKELSGEVLKLVKRHKQMEKEQAAASSAKAIQDKEMRALLKRISVLQEEANTHGRLRMTTIAERDDLKQRLDVLQMQMLQERSLSQNFAEQADSNMQRVTKHQREQRTAKELVVQRLVQMACRQRKGRVVLDLSKCFINDALLSTVVTRFREGSMLQNVKMLNLRCNEITDRGARRLAMLFSKCDVLPEEVDLRQNRIDTPGIRALAQAMQRNKIFASAYVYMHLDGRIQAIGNTGKDTQTIGAEEDGDPLPESDPSGEIQSLAVIDVRDNFYAEDTDRGAGPKIKKKKSESTGRTKKFGFSDGNTKPARTFKPKRSVASAYGSSRKPAKVKRSKTAFAKSKPKVEDGEEPPTNPANSNSLSALPALYQTSS